MIVGDQKPFDENWEHVKDFKKVLVFGCNTCVAVCHSGGVKEAEIMASMLRMKAKQEGVDIDINHLGIERHCEPEFFTPVMDDVRSYDLVLSLACGVGVNFLADSIGDIQVYPGLNTSFYGAVPEPGVFTEMCAGCGDCITYLTGGICPIARCSKSLMNGPCGGTDKGKCEVGQDVDCGWFLIVERMKRLGQLDKLGEVQPPRNWSSSSHGGPRRLTKEHLKDLEQEEERQEAGRDS
jgi:ferredoxin